MATSVRQRGSALFLDAAIVFGFACVLIAAGHGVGFIGLLLTLGTREAWGVPIGIAWLGIFLLLMNALVLWRWLYISFAVSGIVLLATAWWLIVSESEMLAFSVMGSLPLLGAMVYRLWFLKRQVSEAG